MGSHCSEGTATIDAMGHDHHDHDHSELGEMDLRVRALETVLARKGYIDPAALDGLPADWRAAHAELTRRGRHRVHDVLHQRGAAIDEPGVHLHQARTRGELLLRVGGRHHAVPSLHLGQDRFGDVPLVKGIAALLLQQAQGLRQTRVADDAVERRCALAGQERGPRIGIRAQRAKEWRLIDDYAKPQAFADALLAGSDAFLFHSVSEEM